MDFDKKYRRLFVQYDAAPDLAVQFLSAVYDYAKKIGFHNNYESGNLEYIFYRQDGTEVVDTIHVSQTQHAVRIELRGWPFLGEEQFVQYFKDCGLEIEHRYRFTVTIDSRQKLQMVVEQTLQEVGISRYFTVDMLSRVRVVDVRVNCINEYGDYCAEVFFNYLRSMN